MEITIPDETAAPASATLTMESNDGKSGCEGTGIRQHVLPFDYPTVYNRIFSERK